MIKNTDATFPEQDTRRTTTSIARVLYIYMAFYGESPVVVRQWNFMERYSVQSVYKVTKGLKIFNIMAMTHLLSKKNISK